MNFVCSDLHGNDKKYRAMLEKIRLGSDDRLFVLGDVIDRGKDGVQILRDMRDRPNIFPILGNHELTAAMCLPQLLEEVTERSLAGLDDAWVAGLSEWVMNGGGPTLRALNRLSREERGQILEYIRDMALYEEVEAGGRTFVLVHAGLGNFSPDKPLEDYELTELLLGRPREDGVYYRDKTVILGHTPTRLLGGKDKILFRGTMIGVDCGCGFGGPLGCLCLETMEEFYV